MAHWTEEEAIAFGLVKDPDGNWRQRKTTVRSNDTGKVPKLESGALKQLEKENGIQKANEGSGRKSNRVRIVTTARCRVHTDPDNLCPKWFIDRLSEFGVIPDDSSEYVSEVVKRVVKVEKWECETTTIEVYVDESGD